MYKLVGILAIVVLGLVVLFGLNYTPKQKIVLKEVSVDVGIH